MDNIKYGPVDTQGREFKKGDEWVWIYVCFDNRNMYCKVKNEDIDDIAQGKPFMAYNPWTMGKDGFVYLPALSMTIEPMFVTRASMLSYVHYKVADDLDKMTEGAFSNIVKAKESDIPKPMPKLIL